ncbi:MAG: argininosuccinate lyase [Betaproteobacteria bacterium]|nr:argininosuccinate lyase [Betaproteobacteria bacterium]
MSNSLDRKQEAWSARFNEPVSEIVKRYTASVGFDQRLADADIKASLAHAQMLSERGIITNADFNAIVEGMARIRAEIDHGAFVWSIDLEDVHLNIERRLLCDLRRRVNRLPLGAAALAGTSFPIDRERVAALLDFEGLCENSLDAVSDRDFAIEYCAAASLIAVHFSRLSEELVLWMSPNIAFIDLPDRFCTGSSIMPQKKNPDVPELARGKTGRVVGHLMGLLMLMKAQPLAYNKDNQEDKEPLFDTVDTITDSLRIYIDLIAGIMVREERMREAAGRGYATATDLADYLVRKGMAFRDAHEAVALAVREADREGIDLSALSLERLKEFSNLIEDDVYQVLSLEGSLAARNHVGGTAPAAVLAAIARHQKRLA